MSRLIAKTVSQGYSGAGNEITLEPSGALESFGANREKYPRFIRNGYFKSLQNTWSNPVTSGSSSSQMAFDGWHVKQGGSCSANAAREDKLGDDGWPSRFVAALTVTAVGGNTSDYVILEQREFDLTQYAGKNLTVDFDAQSVGGRKIAVEFVSDEDNGTTYLTKGGVFDLESEIKTFTARASIPQLSGAALGSMHKIVFRLWLVAGSDYISRLGTQLDTGTGTVRLSGFRDRSRSYEPSARDEINQVRRYYGEVSQTHFLSMGSKTAASTTAIGFIPFPVPLAYTPTASDISTTNQFLTGTPSINDPGEYGFSVVGTASSGSSVARLDSFSWDIELPQ